MCSESVCVCERVDMCVCCPDVWECLSRRAGSARAAGPAVWVRAGPGLQEPGGVWGAGAAEVGQPRVSAHTSSALTSALSSCQGVEAAGPNGGSARSAGAPPAPSSLQPRDLEGRCSGRPCVKPSPLP